MSDRDDEDRSDRYRDDEERADRYRDDEERADRYRDDQYQMVTSVPGGTDCPPGGS